MMSFNTLPEDIRSRLEAGSLLSLELGCGDHKRHPEAVGIDSLKYDGVDIVGDIETVLSLLPENCVSAVYSYHCFEHLTNLGQLMGDLGRIMVTSARLKVVVPHFSNPYYYSDATHRQPFGLYTFSYYAKDSIFSRQCPTYQRKIQFELKSVDLIFKSPKPFYVRYGLKKIVQGVVNLNRYFKEYYEENLCWLLPCYELHYEMVRL
jgi:hypothetical protein